MNYQPNLYVFNADNTSSKSIYQVIKDLGFGRINYVERDTGGVYVAMDHWNMKITASTRMKLQQGKPLLLYYSDDKFWKVYAYEHRLAEEEHKKRIEKKRAIQLKATLHKEKQNALREQKERKERKERKEKQEKQEKEAQLRKQQEQEIDAMLESFKQASIDEENDYMEENDYRQAFIDEEDEAKTSIVTSLDYGNAAELYPIIKARAKKMFDRLKNNK